MNVYTYETAGGKDLIFDYLDSLPKKKEQLDTLFSIGSKKKV